MKVTNLLAGVLLFGGILFAQDVNLNKVPDSFAARLWKVQNDRTGLNAQIQLITQQYQVDQATLAHDNEEFDQIKAEAIKAAGRDANKTDIDQDKKGDFEFISKAAEKPADKK